MFPRTPWPVGSARSGETFGDFDLPQFSIALELAVSLNIPDETILKVRVLAESEELRGNGLRILRADQPPNVVESQITPTAVEGRTVRPS